MAEEAIAAAIAGLLRGDPVAWEAPAPLVGVLKDVEVALFGDFGDFGDFGSLGLFEEPRSFERAWGAMIIWLQWSKQTVGMVNQLMSKSWRLENERRWGRRGKVKPDR
jgi:hypothetical protein